MPVLDNWWQTETAHAITATAVGLGHSLDPPKDVTGMPVSDYLLTIVNINHRILHRFLDSTFACYART